MLYQNFYTSVWYCPTSERDSVKPSSFLLKSPSYKLYTQISQLNEYSDGIVPNILDDLILKFCIEDFSNVSGLSSITDLPLDIKKELLDTIISLYYPDISFLELLDLNLDLLFDPTFSNDTWSCEICQAKRIDRQRNCPFLDVDEYHDDEFVLQVNERLFTVCPIPQKDNLLIAKALEAFKVLDLGFMPEAGGYGDQPVFWVIVSQKVKEKINMYEKKQLEEERAKLKR